MRHLFSMGWCVAVAAASVLGMASCTKQQFHISGAIANAKDSVLYFEHNGLEGFDVLDSVKLDESGNFEFRGEPSNAPEFYRLRIAGQIINIAIDSTETVDVKAGYPLMATDYDVKGSYENEKIRELALKQIALQNQCNDIALNAPVSADSAEVAIKRLVDAYKEDVKRNYIFKEPGKAYAYFALFQYIVIGNAAKRIFNPADDLQDTKVFGAVATSWDVRYPNSARGKNLHGIAVEGLKNERIVRAQSNQSIEVDPSKVSVAGVIDLPLYDNKGNVRHLTDLQGKVVLLNFHVFESEGSPQFIMALRDLYDRYHAQGLEIYQVSLDENEHFWKTQTAALPWVSVHDDGSKSQPYLAPVTASPVFYLIDRGNNIVKNPSQIKDLDAEIRALL